MPGDSAIRSQIGPVSAILGEAVERHVDVIVVGVQARSAWDRFVHGGVAAQVVRRAACSVLVAPIAV